MQPRSAVLFDVTSAVVQTIYFATMAVAGFSHAQLGWLLTLLTILELPAAGWLIWGFTSGRIRPSRRS